MNGTIRTPDQRVRVFISSTIGELSEERLAAKEAIEELHLIPVYFEMGARPHPPRDLYQAYLAQSHVFIGIYWNNYGWIAPGMEISGLEDEYQLSSSKPRLIYIKNTNSPRDPGLIRLLKEIENGSTVCYQKFSTPSELKSLIESDLALLLSEHYLRKSVDDTPYIQKRTQLPFNPSPLIGRKSDVDAILNLLAKEEVRLLTITGPGGTGKSRISTQIANEMKSGFRDGVFFIPLANVNDPELFAGNLADNLGIFDSGKQPLKETITNFLFDKSALILIDNFEQILSAAPFLSELLTHCRHIKIIVTSRSPLHLRDEFLYPLSPLPAPTQADLLQLTALMDYPSIELFIRRAQEINPGIQFDRQNLIAIAQICNKLDGIPLAIELAAARTKLLSPPVLLERMEKTLDTLVKGPRDLPDRHKTLRAAIDWSYQLLDDTAKQIFRRLGIFNGSWTMEAAEEIVNWDKADILEMLEKLIDFALIQGKTRKYDTVFSMFETVREFANELLETNDERQILIRKHADFYIHFLDEAKHYLWTPQREVWLLRIDSEYANIREAFANMVSRDDFAGAWRIIQALGFYWTAYGKISDAVKWINEAHVSTAPQNEPIRKEIDLKVQAAAFRAAGMIYFFTSSFKLAVDALNESANLFIEAGEEMEAGRSMAYLGIGRISAGDFQAASNFQQALDISKKHNDPHGFVMASTFISEVLAGSGKTEEAKSLITESIRIAKEKDDHMLCCLSLGQRGNIEVILGNYSAAAEFYRESLSYEKKARLGSLVGWYQLGLGICMLMSGDLQEAKKYLNTALATGRNVGDKAVILSVFIGFAFLALKKNDVSKAARLYGAAEYLIQISDYKLWNESRRMNEMVLNALSDPSNSDIADPDRQRGFEMTIEEAIELALSE